MSHIVWEIKWSHDTTKVIFSTPNLFQDYGVYDAASHLADIIVSDIRNTYGIDLLKKVKMLKIKSAEEDASTKENVVNASFQSRVLAIVLHEILPEVEESDAVDVFQPTLDEDQQALEALRQGIQKAKKARMQPTFHDYARVKDLTKKTWALLLVDVYTGGTTEVHVTETPEKPLENLKKEYKKYGFECLMQEIIV